MSELVDRLEQEQHAWAMLRVEPPYEWLKVSLAQVITEIRRLEEERETPLLVAKHLASAILQEENDELRHVIEQLQEALRHAKAFVSVDATYARCEAALAAADKVLK